MFWFLPNSMVTHRQNEQEYKNTGPIRGFRQNVMSLGAVFPVAGCHRPSSSSSCTLIHSLVQPRGIQRFCLSCDSISVPLNSVACLSGSHNCHGPVIAITRFKTKLLCSSSAKIRAMSSSSSDAALAPKPFGVLFVCLGNICRSPTAEAVFRGAVQKRNLTSLFKIDSAGTINYHEGEPADPRMKNTAKKRGIEITSISRPIKPSDFQEFDLILAMDKQNKADILEAFEDWKSENDLPPNASEKVKLMCSYCRECEETEVPDPYYGGPQGFEKSIHVRFF